MSPFESLREYERFIYTLQKQFPRVVRSTLVVAQRGRFFAELKGEVTFLNPRDRSQIGKSLTPVTPLDPGKQTSNKDSTIKREQA
jgi:hypothetical protein